MKTQGQTPRLIQRINNSDKVAAVHSIWVVRSGYRIKSKVHSICECIKPRYKIKRKEIWCFVSLNIIQGKMTTAEVENKAKRIIARQLGCDISSIASNAHLQKNLYADSLDILSIKVSIENAFDICFTERELQNLLQVDAIIEMVHGKLS